MSTSPEPIHRNADRASSDVLCPAAPPLVSIATPRKKLVRRTDRDYSQQLRLGFQLAFLALNVWIGVQFYQWVRWAETEGVTPTVARPAGIEGWLPIAGLMQFKYVLLTGEVPRIHPAGFFLFTAFLLMSFLLRKSFCGWLCPVGTLSEYLWKLGRSTFRRNFALPRWLDLGLRSLKYLLLGFFAYAVFSMSAAAIAEFLTTPYGLIVDVRMLNFFRYLGGTAAFVILGLIVASIFVQNFWCRYLCPYGALMGIAALLSPLRITRREPACIDCAKCAKVCPAALPVDKLVQIRSAECTGCLECIAVCPAKDALVLAAPGKRAVPAWSMAAGIAIIFFGLVGYAKLTRRWDTQLPKQVYFQLVPTAGEQQHPAPGE
ncbi:MAG TPA: 4Fe-4S binding protein [Terriglobales bacterium]